jgi:hypothetical protein
MSIKVKLSDYVDFLYHNACERFTTYVWCNDDGDLFGDNEYYDGCHRIGFADYSHELDEANITQYSDNADMAKMILANALMEGEGYPIIGETGDGEDIEIVN